MDRAMENENKTLLRFTPVATGNGSSLHRCGKPPGLRCHHTSAAYTACMTETAESLIQSTHRPCYRFPPSADREVRLLTKQGCAFILSNK